jgi:hypothetical protein
MPEFDGITGVLPLRVEHRHGVLDVAAGQAVIARKGEWARYSCVYTPAFSPETVRRDED